tara:strand:- start:256 stop:816 length:561 start_codon:yes stop_codon:yes gene_type:complete
MTYQSLIIYDFPLLYDILREFEENLNFKLIKLSKKELFKLDNINKENHVILTKKNMNFNNSLVVDSYPIKVEKLIETINIFFLKSKFNNQSEINIGKYKLNLNSRIIYNSKNKLDLTEKEADIILYLNKALKPVNVAELQKKVWDHHSKLDTHTVETHIYRLRKKISNTFNNNNFIKSSKSGYKIN